MSAASLVSCKGSRLFLFLLTAVSLVLLNTAGTSAFAKDQKKITANYSINFNGLSIGSFNLWSDLSGEEYSMKARARISVLAGILFEWEGNTVSAGRVMADRPLPYTYSFGYRTSNKRETVDVQFSNNNVAQIAVNPPQRQSSKRVPVTRSHMRNVVDPLSAVVMLTNIASKKSAGEVCTRRLPIFDGKARYDLRLTHKKTRNVTTSFGYKGPAHICKVKFQPISGHKQDDDENDYASKNEGIEIWMIPLAEADLHVPYYIYLPTQVGNATLTASGFEVKKSDSARGALLR